MYTTVLTLHNLTRWFVLIIGIWALVRVASGFVRPRPWTAPDGASVQWFALILSLQFVFGAVLYVLPGAFVQSVIGNVSMADIMGTRLLRFFTLEHPVQMILAVGSSHMARSATRRSTTDARRFRAGTALIALTMLLIVTAIPWPFLSHGRPWLRLPF